MELGILTPEEGVLLKLTNFDNEESESQRKLLNLKDEGLYQPVIGGKGAGAAPTGRPAGTAPQETKNVSPIGQGEQSNADYYSISKITDNMIHANGLTKKVEAGLRKFHSLKRLNKRQKEVAQGIVEVIISNENPSDWKKVVDEYVKKPVDKNEDRVSEIRHSLSSSDRLLLTSIFLRARAKRKLTMAKNVITYGVQIYSSEPPKNASI